MIKKSALVGLLFSLVAATSLTFPADAAAPQHKNQAPGYFRVKVGGLEVTSLSTERGHFNLNWLKGSPKKSQGSNRL